MEPGTENTLYYGDNLDVLRRYIADESVDLIYLDPPFNSAQDYNVLFREQDGTRSASQIKAFEDTWRWDEAAARTYQETVESGCRVSLAMQGFRALLGNSDMLAYLSMMAPRLVELRRVLRPSGSIYLHCDPTASHYLKLLLDAVFGPTAFRNEIVWRRTPFSGSSKARARQLPRSHDVIYFYSKDADWIWNAPTVPYSQEYLERFKWKDDRGLYRKTLLKTYSEPTLERLRAENRLIEPIEEGAKFSYKQYLDESPGFRQIDDIWVDINMINPVAKERLGYPTQKPEALLERILSASSNEGDLVLDPFCGCGTTIAAAQRLNRRWIGIDVTHLAITLIRHRLKDAFGDEAKYKIIGEPTSLPDAQTLAASDRFQFQWWALGLVGARPAEQKKGADQGIDGRLYFHDEGAKGSTKQIVLSVKSGGVSVKDVRDIRGVIEREKAAIGVLITLEEPTRPMRSEAAGAGIYSSPWGTKHPVLQVLTIQDLLAGKGIDYPVATNRTFKRAPRSKPKDNRTQLMAL
ncbi:MAG TPA: DNA methyltransferase [candidate division Zixibacteria bacterium]|jgi:DNA modification methylase